MPDLIPDLPDCTIIVGRHTAPIPRSTRDERRKILRAASHNTFRIRNDDVSIDLLSDSGTGATSAAQEAAGDTRPREAYAGASSWENYRTELAGLTGYSRLYPVHQGRGAESCLFPALLPRPGMVSISNTHFDTTRANVMATGAEPVDLPCPEASDLDSTHPFKGNIDVDRLECRLAGPDRDRVGMVLITITNNGGGGQPVSMANLAAARELCHRYRVPLLLDAARFAENAWLVHQREPGYQNTSPREIAYQTFQMADGALASLKKDGLTPEGAFFGFRGDASIDNLDDVLDQAEENLIRTEGYVTYGGLSRRDMEMLAVGLREVLDPAYLRTREQDALYFAGLLADAGVDIVQQPGMHALYVNAGRLLPHLRPADFPGHALACQLFLDGGIRCVELGSLFLGELADDNTLATPVPHELVRLALPRRVYARAHLDYVADVLADIAKEPERVPAYRVVHAPEHLRHFRIDMEPM